MTSRDQDKPGFAALILAAGAGRRLGKLGQLYSKPMVPVLGRPLIDWVIERLAAAGAGPITLVAHPENQGLLDHLTAAHSAIRVVEQPERLGIADAILRAIPTLAARAGFLCSACDSLFAVDDIRCLASSNAAMTAAVGVLEMGLAATRSRSSVTVDGGRVRAIVEKPEHPASPLVALPIYWLPPAIEPFLRQNQSIDGESYVTTALARFIAAGHGVRAVNFRERLELTSAQDLPQIEAALGTDPLSRITAGEG